MSFTPNLKEQELLAHPFRRPDYRLPAREAAVELLVGLAYASVAVWIWRTEPPAAFDVFPAILCLVVLVLAERVRFDTPYGMAFATQLAFVPLLFAIPIAIVPVAVLAAYTIARPKCSPARLDPDDCSSRSATRGSPSARLRCLRWPARSRPTQVPACCSPRSQPSAPSTSPPRECGLPWRRALPGHRIFARAGCTASTPHYR